MDLDISNYTAEDMIEILGLQVVDKNTILKSTESEMKKYEKRPEYVTFFKQMQEYLINTLQGDIPEATPTFQTDVKRGVINPDLKNTVTRFINIDSSCRHRIDMDNLTSDSFDFEITEPLMNVISMCLYSIELPYSWYSNTRKKGTTSFILCQTEPEATTSTRTVLSIPEGNYTTLSLPEAFIKVINDANVITNLTDSVAAAFTINPYTSRCTFTFHTTNVLQLIWFNELMDVPDMMENRINNSIGWMLGFRLPITFCLSNDSNTVQVAQPVSIVDASGTKYVIMVLDEYKPNRINRSLVSVNTNPLIPIQTPSYYNQSVPQYRTVPNVKSVTVMPSNPRTLTLKQIHTINSITNQVHSNIRINSYTGSDSFAKINIKKTEWNKYEGGIKLIDNGPARLIVENGGPLQLQMREYFGPVDISQLSVSLYDDKGHLLGLNGLDWSCTVMVKCIYQYG
jgi:hypothetical protein